MVIMGKRKVWGKVTISAGVRMQAGLPLRVPSKSGGVKGKNDRFGIWLENHSTPFDELEASLISSPFSFPFLYLLAFYSTRAYDFWHSYISRHCL